MSQIEPKVHIESEGQRHGRGTHFKTKEDVCMVIIIGCSANKHNQIHVNKVR